MIRLEFRDDKASKFWHVNTKGTEMTVRYGKIGSTGQTKIKTLASSADAKAEATKLVAQKKKKGYATAKPAAGKKADAKTAKVKASPKPKAKAAEKVEITPKGKVTKKAVEDIISSLTYGSREKQRIALDELRSVCDSNDNVDWIYALLLHLTSEFEATRMEFTKEHTTLRKRLAKSKPKLEKHLAMIEYIHALELFAEHGSSKEKKVRKHLEKATSLISWYQQTIGHFEIGLACEIALKKKDFATLFYLQLQEAQRVGYDVPASPWLLRAITSKAFSSWVLRQKKVPKAPAGLELPEDFDLAWFFGSFFSPDSNEVKSWPAGRLELAASLMLFPSKEKLKIGKAFECMAGLGDLAGLRFLHPHGISKPAYAETLKAVRHTEVMQQLVQWGMSPAQASKTMRELVCHSCERGVYELLLSAGAKPNQVDTNQRYVAGKEITYKQYILHIAAWKENLTAIDVLLKAGADPSLKDTLGKTPANEATSLEAIKLLGGSSTSFSVGDAIAHLGSAKTALNTSQQRKLRQSLKKLGNEAPLKSALSDPGEPMGLLAKALVGAGQSKAKKEKKSFLEERTVIPSALHVSGEFVVSDHVLVLGDVVAKEITIDEGGSLAVAGKLECKVLYCGGQLHVAKGLKATLVTAFDGGHVHAANYQAELSVYYAYCALDAEKISGAYYNFEHGIESDDPQYRELIGRLPKPCVSKKDAEFGVLGIDFRKLIKIALSGKLTLRS